MRLGGLYSIDSGAHNFYARGGEFNMKPDGFINLLHYEVRFRLPPPPSFGR